MSSKLQYDVLSVASTKATLEKNLAKVQGEIKKTEQSAKNPDLASYFGRVLRDLRIQQDDLQHELRVLAGSHEWQTHLEIERSARAARDRKALDARRQARQDAITAEQEKYDGLIDSFNWSMTEPMSTEERRQIARDHAARLAGINQRNEMLANAGDDVLSEVAADFGVSIDTVRETLHGHTESGLFETRATAKNGQKYLIVTDKEGTWIEPDTLGNIDSLMGVTE